MSAASWRDGWSNVNENNNYDNNDNCFGERIDAEGTKWIGLLSGETRALRHRVGFVALVSFVFYEFQVHRRAERSSISSAGEPR
ncbi:MAG TPA: hypothetical protein VLN49_06180 [Gemmatimonadaceae bacterium]|nr:hypothetical protein [Gemmatimonadaceae bacterium]